MSSERLTCPTQPRQQFYVSKKSDKSLPRKMNPGSLHNQRRPQPSTVAYFSNLVTSVKKGLWTLRFIKVIHLLLTKLVTRHLKYRQLLIKKKKIREKLNSKKSVEICAISSFANFGLRTESNNFAEAI